MITIKNANVTLFKNGSVSHISAKMSDQNGDILFKLGRGKMFTEPNAVLAYNEKETSVFLWTR